MPVLALEIARTASDAERIAADALAHEKLDEHARHEQLAKEIRAQIEVDCERLTMLWRKRSRASIWGTSIADDRWGDLASASAWRTWIRGGVVGLDLSDVDPRAIRADSVTIHVAEEVRAGDFVALGPDGRVRPVWRDNAPQSPIGIMRNAIAEIGRATATTPRAVPVSAELYERLRQAYADRGRAPIAPTGKQRARRRKKRRGW